MKSKAPGKYFRKGMTLVQAVQAFADEERVERMFIEARWPNGIACSYCGSLTIKERANRKPAPFRCGDCHKYFSVKSGTVMEGSNLPLSKWALGSFLMSTSLKGVSSMKLHRDLGITQKAAWHLAHRIRMGWERKLGLFSGPVEVDETYIGGKEGNKHKSKRTNDGRGSVGKVPVIGMKDRDTNQVSLQVVENTGKHNLFGFIVDHADPSAHVYTDGLRTYKGMGMPRHQVVDHSQGEYVLGDIHTNGIEGLWAMLKRGITGTYHHISEKHTQRYATEFGGRHNDRPLDTIVQVRQLIKGMEGKRLRYKDLIA